MAKRSLKWRGFGIEVEIPPRLTAAIRNVVRPREQAASDRATTLIDFPDEVPPLHPQHRDSVVEPYIEGLRGASPWYPDAWTPAESDAALAAQVARQIWYHTLELPGGVVTPGYYDQRTLIPHYGLPKDLTGKRVLDVGAWDGFWSFEFERRGADVTAVDLDLLSETDFPPPLREAVLGAGLDQRLGGGFEIARRALGSNVKRIAKSVYDLDPGELGTFDLVHFADVSLHLERPLEAFRRIRAMTGGQAMIVDAYNPDLDADPTRTYTEYLGGWGNATWWIPSLNTFVQMVLDAGFSDVRIQKTYRLNPRAEGGLGRWRAVLIATP
jgi:tRNA (mo5U34)-methyltransferase